ncbi:hypothetical protein SK128_021842 [Halocaridina rubra]|uniref:Nuclear protein MDM1 n=1 Tax=Halocaridina rubra TaxID=373956 RepID=A0AAN8X729_HALRR
MAHHWLYYSMCLAGIQELHAEYIGPIYICDCLLRAYKSEYRKKFRPFSQYQYVDGKFHKVKTDEPSTSGESANNWYKEVIELRRQAGQYRMPPKRKKYIGSVLTYLTHV